MPDDLYLRDSFVWSRRQAELLRRVAAGQRLNDLDWPHVIEKIEDVGLSALRRVRSLPRHAIERLLKLHGWPNSASGPHWRTNVIAFLSDTEDAVTPGMRHLIDLNELYRRAVRNVAADTMKGRPSAAALSINPFMLEDLLTDPPDIDALLARLRDA